MADNVQLSTNIGTGDVAAADDIGGVKHQRVKIEHGADGSATDVSTASPLPTRSIGATAAPANVAENASSVALIASNAARLSWSVYNDSDAALNIHFGASASASAFVIRLLPRGFTSHRDFGGAVYTGAINGIWDSAPGTSGHASARVCEVTA